MAKKLSCTVITVVFNGGKTLEKTIESVLRQSRPPQEYLIVDGASRDNTLEVAASYQQAFFLRGISYRILSEKDKGIYDAMNKGIALAAGDVIGLLNSGDWYEPLAIEEAMEMLERGGDMVFSHIRLWKESGLSWVKKARLDRFPSSRHWNHPTMFVRAGLYKSHPFPCLGIHDDFGFYLEMRRKGADIRLGDAVWANFSLGGASNRKSLRDSLARLRDRYLYCYRRHGYSRAYLAECILIEAAKWILA